MSCVALERGDFRLSVVERFLRPRRGTGAGAATRRKWADMHAITFLQDLAVVMIVAALVTVVFHRLRQPVVLGYIMAGSSSVPHTAVSAHPRRGNDQNAVRTGGNPVDVLPWGWSSA